MVHRITVTLTEDQYIGLQEVAGDAGKGLSDTARDAINHYLLTEHWGLTVGKVAEAAIEERKTNDEVLQLVREKFPHAKTSPASVAWYRSQMRKKNADIPTDAQAKHERGVE